MSANPHWLTIEQAAERLQLSNRTVRAWIAERRLPAYRSGRTIRIKTTDVDAALAPMNGGGPA